MKLFFGHASTILATASLSAAILVEIDISNPAVVTINSVTNNASQNVSGNVGFSVGLSFENFFTSAQDLTAGAAISGTWTARGTTLPYNEVVSFVYGNPAVQAGDDLSIYHTTGGQNQDFVTTAPAFSGSSTVNLAAFTAALPTIGSTGPVNIGYQLSQGGQIGEWTVVPEPRYYAGALGAVALICASVGRWRFKAA